MNETASLARDPAPSIDTDLALVGRIGSVPLILRILCDTTHLRLAALGRITGETWTACAVLDRVGFGLQAGDEFDLETTLCHEVGSSAAPLVIDRASTDPLYRHHPMPKQYGFESYVAVPVFRRDGTLFGTICGLDPEPHALSTATRCRPWNCSPSC